jgi:response regulator RpfG family c-di-GMP phosphodiesterase
LLGNLFVVGQSMLDKQVNAAIILLDAEKNMLAALQRVVMPLGVALYHAATARQALGLCSAQRAHLLITDMRIADAQIADFLQQASQAQPGIRKLILTGFADLEQTISAINEGQINRYFTKPWDNLVLRDAINEELALFAGQQRAVAQQAALVQRAVELELKAQAASRQSEASAQQLRSVRHETVMDFYHRLLSYRFPRTLRFSQQVAHWAAALAQDMALESDTVVQVHAAAALHQVGMAALPFTVRDTRQMSAEQLAEYRQYPEIGAEVIQGDVDHDPVATLIRYHREDFCGGGYPNQLAAEDIPLGARIIRLAIDFQAVLDRKGRASAVALLQAGASSYYDPQLVTLFLNQTLTDPSNLELPYGNL